MLSYLTYVTVVILTAIMIGPKIELSIVFESISKIVAATSHIYHLLVSRSLDGHLCMA